MEPVLKDLRKGQWRWDYAVASHGAAFHAPQEVMRLLGSAMEYAKDARLQIARVVARHGFTGQILFQTSLPRLRHSLTLA